jgi:hypothetical protein
MAAATAWPRRGRGRVRAETTAWPRRGNLLFNLPSNLPGVTAAVRAVAKNAATDESVGGDGSAPADTVGDGDVTAVAECR